MAGAIKRPSFIAGAMMYEANERPFIYPVLRMCAHCGNDARYELALRVADVYCVWIECDACGASTNVHYHDDEGVAVLYAAQAWNRRVERVHVPSPNFPAGWQVMKCTPGSIVVASPTGDAYAFTRTDDPLRMFLWKFLTAVIDAKQTMTEFTAL
jgi:Restriction alleviation protein Lar